MKKVICICCFLFLMLCIAPLESKAMVKEDNIIDLEIITEESATETTEKNEITEEIIDSGASEDNVLTSESDSDVSTNNSELENVKDITSGLTPDISTENFFQRIYNKLFSACNSIQIVIAILLIICFAVLTLLVVGAFISGNKAGRYLLGMLVTVIMFFCDIYATQIITACSNFLAK